MPPQDGRGGGGGGRGRGGRGGRGGGRGRGGRGGGGRGGGGSAEEKPSTTKREESELARLALRWASEAPPSGSLECSAALFSDLPLSHYTLSALARAGFSKLTGIQRLAIPHACVGRDILGAAKTGSGKTLAFLVPLLEALYHARWSAAAGLGAVVVSPTRELAAQIFEVLRSVGSGHYALSAGLLTGGKDFEEESAAVGALAILVATPGRLLQHLEQSAALDPSGLRVLVLDEADRLLDLGFADTLNAILAYLPPPPQRQTLLFSATQTKSVRDLARLSLAGVPEYISVHEAAPSATPARLSQHYVVCRAQDKVNLLFSFLRSHLTSKCIVFVASCKLAHFLFEAFRRLRPGTPLQLLHGKMKQARRSLVYADFCKKPAAVLFATDVASRGLDFPSVDWVLQLDAPEDAGAYIHRVGRTARHTSGGHALLVLTPGEEAGAVRALAAARVPLQRTHIAASAAISVTGKLAGELAADPALKSAAQRAFVSYVRSCALQADKTVFQLRDIDGEALAASYGLAAMPECKLGKFLGGGSGGGGGGGRGALGEGGSSSSGGGGGGGSSGGGAVLQEAEAARMREEAHALKNSNKGLARLKEKIAQERAEKKKQRALAEDSEEEEEDEEDGDDDDDSDSDSGSFEEDDEEEEEDDEEEEEEEEEDGAAPAPADDLLVSKGIRTPKDLEAGDGNLTVSRDDLAGLSDKSRSRLIAVVRDTKLLGAGGAYKGSDGLTPFERLAAGSSSGDGGSGGGGGAGGEKRASAAPPSAAALGAAAASYAEAVAKRLAAAAAGDKARERERVQAKHREERARERPERAEGGGGYKLGGEEEEEEGEEEGEEGEGGDAEDSSEGEEGDEEEEGESEESEEEAPAPQGRKRQAEAQGRPEAKRAKPVPAGATLQSLEALALQRLGASRK